MAGPSIELLQAKAKIAALNHETNYYRRPYGKGVLHWFVCKRCGRTARLYEGPSDFGVGGKPGEMYGSLNIGEQCTRSQQDLMRWLFLRGK